MKAHEMGFGPRLRHGQDILSFISGFPGYNPPRPQESAAGFSAFLASIDTANAEGAALVHAWSSAVAQRHAAFKEEPGSVEKLLPLILGAVESQYGKSSVERKTVAAIIRRMRSTRIIRPPVDPAETSAESTAAYSSSEQSYGSLTFLFNNLKTALSGFTAYNPSNASIQLTGLNALSASLSTLNNAVAAAYLALQNARNARLAAYAELKDRVQRIKAYVKAQYGTGSSEYKLIRGIRV